MIHSEVLRDISGFETRIQNLFDKLHSGVRTQKTLYRFWKRAVLLFNFGQKYLLWRKLEKAVREFYKKNGVPLEYPMLDLPCQVKGLPLGAGEVLLEYSEHLLEEIRAMGESESHSLQEIKELGLWWSAVIAQKNVDVIVGLLDAVGDVYTALDALYGPHKEEIAVFDREFVNRLSRTA